MVMSNLDKQGEKLCKGCNKRFTPKKYDTHILEIIRGIKQ